MIGSSFEPYYIQSRQILSIYSVTIRHVHFDTFHRTANWLGSHQTKFYSDKMARAIALAHFSITINYVEH